MKKIVLTSLMMVCLPFLAVAQSVEDDLYFIPKKKAEKKEEVKQEVKVAVPQKQNNTTVYAAPGSTVVVKDVKGNMRDVDEYNRRYTSRDNTFSMENDTLYIEEKPLNERGEWVNGFEGSQDDYEYAMRIVRFRNPRYAIGMWFTDFPLGIGMCMMTDCMHTFSPLIQIDYGGIGALTIFTDPDGASAGDGLHHGIIAVGIPIIGMAVTGVAAIGDTMLGIITVRAFMPADITTIITHHARTVIIT